MAYIEANKFFLKGERPILIFFHSYVFSIICVLFCSVFFKCAEMQNTIMEKNKPLNK